MTHYYTKLPWFPRYKITVWDRPRESTNASVWILEGGRKRHGSGRGRPGGVPSMRRRRTTWRSRRMSSRTATWGSPCTPAAGCKALLFDIFGSRQLTGPMHEHLGLPLLGERPDRLCWVATCRWLFLSVGIPGHIRGFPLATIGLCVLANALRPALFRILRPR